MIFLKAVTALHRWGVAGVEVSIEPRLTFDLQAGGRWGSLGSVLFWFWVVWIVWIAWIVWIVSSVE